MGNCIKGSHAVLGRLRTTNFRYKFKKKNNNTYPHKQNKNKNKPSATPRTSHKRALCQHPKPQISFCLGFCYNQKQELQ